MTASVVVVDPTELATVRKVNTVIDLNKVLVRKGNHSPQQPNPHVQASAMELVSILANEPWSDHPACACPYITAFVINWQNSITDDAVRTELMRPLIPRIIGTRGNDALMLRRMWMGLDWDIRVRTPAFLRIAGLEEHAVALENLSEITSQTLLVDARKVAQRAAKAASGARAAAGAAAGDSAWDAAGAAAWAAARAAARAAAGDSAWASAWAAAGDATGDAAGDSAWDATGDAARDAAWAAARDASRERLAPLVASMQSSAQDLVMRMCALREVSQ